jgi:hypothetical protein
MNVSHSKRATRATTKISDNWNKGDKLLIFMTDKLATITRKAGKRRAYRRETKDIQFVCGYKYDIRNPVNRNNIQTPVLPFEIKMVAKILFEKL